MASLAGFLGFFAKAVDFSSMKNQVASFILEQIIGRFLEGGVVLSEQLELDLASGDGLLVDVHLNLKVCSV